MYYGCTKAGYRDDLEPWCSTKVNPINSVHVIGAKYFGNCTKSEACPLHEKALTKLDILQSIFSPSKYLILIPVYSVWVADVWSHAGTCKHMYAMCVRVALFWACYVWFLTPLCVAHMTKEELFFYRSHSSPTKEKRWFGRNRYRYKDNCSLVTLRTCSTRVWRGFQHQQNCQSIFAKLYPRVTM